MMVNSFKRSDERGEEHISSPITDEMGAQEECDTNIAPSTNKYDSLVTSIDRMLDEIEPSVTSEYCIYRVPQKIRKINEEAYNPRVVSIGPFHHGDERFRSMEVFKKRYFKKVVRKDGGVHLKKYIEFLKCCEASIRQCYSEIIQMDSDKFVTMMLVDGCFIIELLLGTCFEDFRDIDHSILSSARLWNDIYRDLILLENQIPFFVLEGIFNIAMTDFELPPFLILALCYFDQYNVQQKPPTCFKSIKHFTDLILILHRPMPQREVEEFQSACSATELNEAGVKFTTGSSNCLLDIKFSDGVLEIPCISLYDKTESLIRNLMALELCHYSEDSYMIDYFSFMDFLLNTPKDVDLLIQNGIIKNWLGDSKQAAGLFNNLNKNIVILSSNFYFSGLCKELNAHCKVTRHKWKAMLKRDYFCSPWRTASTSAAIVLLALTFIQTVCSVLSAAKGN
ncbi:hypothetical protein LguiA_033106 [Lonicera macranthoides]